MSSKKFTEEEMELLRESHYVIKVTENVVHFSAEFKQKFWESVRSGETPRDAVIGLGIDPEILGMNRVNGIKAKIWGDIKAGKGFCDILAHKRITPEQRIKHLEQQLAYKDQEIEFLKKIVSLSREGGEP